MTTSENKPTWLRCPSSQPTEPDAVVFGVVTGSVDAPLIGYLTEVQPVTQALLDMAKPARPGQVFRTAAHCAGHGCKHFDGADCRLAKRIVAFLDPVVSGLPACQIRPSCLWFRQEGKAACLRCPQVVNDRHVSADEYRRVGDPDHVALEDSRDGPEASVASTA
jgi:hypothetical protein